MAIPINMKEHGFKIERSSDKQVVTSLEYANRKVVNPQYCAGRIACVQCFSYI